ncbi:MAG: alpha/beta hydrolase fold domain-containing protein [Bacteroidetes bacterium]|nr:alpha/beta hydrolase fold domain-containing protein [Bacteroidota bacterium]
MKINKQQLDPELRKFYGPMKFAAGLLGRAWTVRMLNRLGNLTKGAKIKGLNCAEQWIPGTAGGPDIRVRIFGPANATGKLPGMLYIHGGGYITGSPESFLEVIHRFIATKPCIIVSPAYRRALDAPYPAAFDDCYSTLLWMKANAETLGMIADKFIVAGHSAGGGLTAAVSLKATDTQDVAIAFQMPIYPMIDDRQNTASTVDNNAPVWNAKTNKFGWKAYLQDLNAQHVPIPAYAAAARDGLFEASAHHYLCRRLGTLQG